MTVASIPRSVFFASPKFRSLGLTLGPILAGLLPEASRAATGAKTSRPWKVLEAGRQAQSLKRNGDLVGLGRIAWRAQTACCRQEQAVVRPHEDLSAALHHQAQPVRAHAGIDNGEVNGSGRKVAGTGEQGKGTGAHILGRDVVGDVHEGYVLSFVRKPGENHALHLGRVKGAEVGEQRYDLHAVSTWISACLETTSSSLP